MGCEGGIHAVKYAGNATDHISAVEIHYGFGYERYGSEHRLLKYIAKLKKSVARVDFLTSRLNFLFQEKSRNITFATVLLAMLILREPEI